MHENIKYLMQDFYSICFGNKSAGASLQPHNIGYVGCLVILFIWMLKQEKPLALSLYE